MKTGIFWRRMRGILGFGSGRDVFLGTFSKWKFLGESPKAVLASLDLGHTADPPTFVRFAVGDKMRRRGSLTVFGGVALAGLFAEFVVYFFSCATRLSAVVGFEWGGVGLALLLAGVGGGGPRFEHWRWRWRDAGLRLPRPGERWRWRLRHKFRCTRRRFLAGPSDFLLLAAKCRRGCVPSNHFCFYVIFFVRGELCRSGAPLI